MCLCVFHYQSIEIILYLFTSFENLDLFFNCIDGKYEKYEQQKNVHALSVVQRFKRAQNFNTKFIFKKTFRLNAMVNAIYYL